jgi:hypothetical protein
MREHVIRLCIERDIVVTWCERPNQAWASREIEEVCIPPILSEISYATAMHEIGHLLGRHQDSERVLTRERWAWEWARKHALVWTNRMERTAVSSLDWYRARIADARGR